MPEPHRTRRPLWCLLATLIVARVVGVAAAEKPPGSLDEYTGRAALVLNLARFAHWSGPAPDAFPICVAGDQRFFSALEALAQQKQIGGRPVRVSLVDLDDGDSTCRVLYIGPEERHAALLLLEGGSVLTIGETPGFIRDGGMVRLFVRDNRLGFEVNEHAVEDADIRIPAQVLALSRR